MSLYRVEMADGQVCEVALQQDKQILQADVGGQRYALRLLGRCPQRGFLVEINGQMIHLPSDPDDPHCMQNQIKGISVHLPPPPPPTPQTSVITITSPMAGIILSIPVVCGQILHPGQTLLLLEAMKMENTITCRETSVLESLEVAQGDAVRKGQALLRLAPLRSKAP